jgi:hypothetical protein
VGGEVGLYDNHCAGGVAGTHFKARAGLVFDNKVQITKCEVCDM